MKLKEEKKNYGVDFDSMSNSEAIRLQNVVKAKIAELELKEKEGTLVQKSVVYDQLLEYGTKLNNAMLAITDWITDNLIASTAFRDKMHNLICAAIFKEINEKFDLKS